MEKRIVSDGATRYTRISKRQAKTMWDKGEPIYLIAHKLRPGMPFSMGMVIDSAGALRENVENRLDNLCLHTRHTFEGTVRDFCYCNADSYETGTYAAFYSMGPVTK